MSWPTMTDYQEAIQNPHLCFDDPELKHGSPTLDLLGLPRPITGGFASVYQMNCNGRKYAVRCFLRHYPDREQRYAIISGYLKQAGLPCMVDFEFLSQGIKVRNQWYPILKMEWVEGDTLNKYIEKNLGNPQVIQGLANKFLKLISGLRLFSISHGDLQHGNILVVNGDFRLIDYDGMYVPGLENMSSHELGHRNYQHPLRAEKEFGPELDNFSAWIIYISLIVLSVDQSLWQRSGAGEEYLLFQRKDFENPGTSMVLLALKQIKSGKVQAVVSLLPSLIRCTDLTQIPSPDETLIKSTTPRISAFTLPGWIKDHVKIRPSAKTPAVQNPNPGTGSSWILDHIEPVPPIDMNISYLKERLLLGAFGAATVFLAYAAANDMVTLTKAASAICGTLPVIPVFFTLRFRSLPEVSNKLKLRTSLRNLQKEIKQLENNIKHLNDMINKLDEKESQSVFKITSKQREITKKKKNELDGVSRGLQTILAEINLERQRLELAEASEAVQASQDLQNSFLPQKLASHELSRATILGVGTEIKKRLMAAGIKTAADIIDIHTVLPKTSRNSQEKVLIEVIGRGKVYIEGIGPQKATAILDWRRNIESRIKSQIQTSIIPAREAAIKSKYQPWLQELDSREYIAIQEEGKRKGDIRAKYRQTQSALAREIRGIRNQYAKMRRDIDREIEDKENHLSLKQLNLANMQQELIALQSNNFKAYLKRILFLL